MPNKINPCTLPDKAPGVPSYRLHKPSGKAVVTLSGRDFYLGPHGSPESRARYDRMIAEWLANGRRLPARADAPPTPAEPLSVAEVVLRYLEHAERKYAGRRNFADLMARFKAVLRPLREHYGLIAAERFGPRTFKLLREHWVAGGLSRKTVNENAGIVRACFAWAVSEELLPPAVYHGLQAVASLRRGETAAREGRKVRPVEDAWVDAIRPFVARQVWAAVELQRLTGARPGEILGMRSRDVDTSGAVWLYRPAEHKTQELHGHERVIALGPQAQDVLRPWLRLNVDEPLLSPREA